VRLSSGDEEVICERAASGVASFFVFIFPSCLPAPRLYKLVVGWRDFFASSHSFFHCYTFIFLIGLLLRFGG
jgi:hypothetical protein